MLTLRRRAQASPILRISFTVDSSRTVVGISYIRSPLEECLPGPKAMAPIATACSQPSNQCLPNPLNSTTQSGSKSTKPLLIRAAQATTAAAMPSGPATASSAGESSLCTTIDGSPSHGASRAASQAPGLGRRYTGLFLMARWRSSASRANATTSPCLQATC